MLRVLVLHGHGMTGAMMRSKLGFLRSETKSFVEWVFVDGPITLTPEQVAESLRSAGRSVGEGPPAAAESAPTSSPPPQLFSRFDFSEKSSDGATRRYRGTDAALRVIDAACTAHGPFDGIFAFSQGCVVSAMWLALQQRALLNIPTEIDGCTALDVPGRHAPLSFAIFCSGLLPTDPTWNDVVMSIAGPATPIRSLHCYGESDEIIPPSWSDNLRSAPLFVASPAVGCAALTHPGGHVVPSAFRKPVKEFLRTAHTSKPTS